MILLFILELKGDDFHKGFKSFALLNSANNNDEIERLQKQLLIRFYSLGRFANFKV